jgi:YD repeat-containing protein
LNTYDDAGNLVSDGTTTYTYDAQNRLIRGEMSDGATTYTYNAVGNIELL